MTTTTKSPDPADEEKYILTSRIQLKDPTKPYSDTELLTILDIIQAEIIKNSLGTLLDSYVDGDGILIVAYEVPNIVGKFLWSAPDSLDRTLISERTRETWEIERTVTYDDFRALSVRK